MIVEITALNHQGYGIGKINNKIIFVENALEGEIVKIKIVENKKKYCIAKVIEYIKTSLNRVSFSCCFYDKCGGCNIAHMCYEKQLEFKKNKVINILDKYCNLSVNPHINFSNELNYRNKVVFHIKDGKIGFYQNNSNFIVDIDKCLILSDSINKVLKIIRTFDLSLVNNIMIRSTYKDIMLVIEGDINKDILSNNLSFVSSIYINGKLVHGSSRIVEKIGNYLFYISYDSFFQVNSKVTYNLYNKILEYASLDKNDNVLDLYCGTGTIGIFLSKYCNKVLGIEINKSAIEDANLNKKINGISNIDFINDNSSYITKLDSKFNVVVVDPPRSGLDSKTLNNLILKRVSRLIYVSCNPMTLARDINKLKEIYNLEKMELFDMFCNDYHVECVVAMILKEHL